MNSKNIWALLVCGCLLPLVGCAPAGGEAGRAKRPAAAAAVAMPQEPGTSPLAVEKQLALLAPAAAEEAAFNFIVFGDNRPGGGGDGVTQPEVYGRIVEEIAGLDSVDFIVDVGDLILGAPGDDALANRMWDEFEKVSAKCGKPFMVVPGNHDVVGGNQEKIYLGRFGRLYYAFDYKGAHFVVLDSDQKGHPSAISPGQLAWLQNELAAAKVAGSAPIFVFIHKPLWEESAGDFDWYKQVHPLLSENGVAAVFAGHDHRYADYGAKDGVHYYVSGGAGAPLEKGSLLTGSFHHYVEVAVKADRAWEVGIYQPGRQPAAVDFVDPERAGRLVKWQEQLLAQPVPLVELPVQLTVVVENPLRDRALSCSFVWQFPEAAWRIEPAEAAFELAAGQMRELAFSLSPAIASFPFPVPALTVNITAGGLPLLSFSKPLALDFVRSAEAVRLAAPPELDGKLEAAWETAGRISGFLVEDGTYIANPPTVVLAGYDDANLYLAFVCYEDDTSALRTGAAKRDDPVWQDDSVEVFITLPGETANYCHFLVSAAGVMQDEKNRGDAWDGAWRAAAAVDAAGKRWIAELAIPVTDLGLESFPGTLRVNLTRSRYVGKPQHSAWNCTFGNFHTPALFGSLRFSE